MGKIKHKKTIAVVGAGVAGLSAAYYLQNSARVLLFEARSRLGGHANPVWVEGSDAGYRVDTGFLVFNLQTYPDFLRFLDDLGVSWAIETTDMRFSMSADDDGLSFSDRSLWAALNGGRNCLNPRAMRLMLELIRFRRELREKLAQNIEIRGSIEAYCQAYHPVLYQDLIIPLASAIWSLPEAELKSYPARAFFQFFDNHGMIQGQKEKYWRTLVGSSQTYLQAFQRQFKGEIHLNAPVHGIERQAQDIFLQFDDARLGVDEVVLATHADRALTLLKNPSDAERQSLAPWRYHESHATLHRDVAYMPRARRQWAAWNVLKKGGQQYTTYYLNTVQALPDDRPLFLTLSSSPLVPSTSLATFKYRHPIFDEASMQSQGALEALNGQDRIWFAGSYFGFGFHQDAVASAMQIVKKMGIMAEDAR